MATEPEGPVWAGKPADWNVLARLAAERDLGEYFLGPPPEAEDVEAASLAGFLPMACRARDAGLDMPGDLFLAKLHRHRSIIFPGQVHAGRTVRRRAEGHVLAFGTDRELIARQCRTTHGDDWLRPALLSALESLGPAHRIRYVSFGLKDCEGNLVAGETGVVQGRRYTSLTGFHSVPGCGMIQLCATGAWLFSRGIRVWDLGMDMAYKTDLGARLLGRKDFLDLLAAGEDGTMPDLPDSDRGSARMLMEAL